MDPSRFLFPLRPGTCYRLSEDVTVVLPPSVDAVSHYSSSEWAETSTLPLDVRYQFVEITAQGLIRPERFDEIWRVAHRVVVDASSALPFEGWVQMARMVRSWGPCLDLRITVGSKIPVNTVAPWVAQAAIMLGHARILFLSIEEVDLFRAVQDVLACHPLAQGAAKIVPVLSVTPVDIAGERIECCDSSTLDMLFLELSRPFCAGIVLPHDPGGRRWQGISLFEVLRRMVTHVISARSALETYLTDVQPKNLRSSLLDHLFLLVRHGSALTRVRTTAVAAKKSVHPSKAELDRIWALVEHHHAGAEETQEFISLRSVVAALRTSE